MRAMLVSLIVSLVSAASLFMAGMVAASDGDSSAVQQAAEKYKIYCAEETVEVSTSTDEQMREERKGKVCRLLPDEFENMYDARAAAKRFGGVGAPCSCE